MNGRQPIKAGLADEYGKVGIKMLPHAEDHNLEKATVFEYTMNDSWSSLFGLKTQSFFGGNLEAELIGKLLAGR